MNVLIVSSKSPSRSRKREFDPDKIDTFLLFTDNVPDEPSPSEEIGGHLYFPRDLYLGIRYRF